MQGLQQKILAAETDELQTLLPQLSKEEVTSLKEVLVVITQLHPDESIQQQAHKKLADLLTPEEQQVIEQSFAIFQSIQEKLPWMGEHKQLQQSNYQAFEKNKAPYEAHIIQSPVFINFYLDLGRKLFMLFDLVDEARSCFESIIQQQPQNAEALYALARIAERYYQKEKALDYYKKCIAANPEHLYGQLQLGILLAKEGDHQAAIDHYNKVIELDPFMAEVYVRVAEAYRGLNDLQRTKQFIEMALDINEYHEEALNLLGTIQWKDEDDVELAIKTFEKGLDHKIHGDSGLLLASLGELHASYLSEHDKAKTYFQKSLKATPNQADTLQKYCRLLESVYQDYGAVSMAFEDFLTHTKDNPQVYTQYAEFLITYMHDYEFAADQLEKALDINPEYESATKLLRQIDEYLEDDIEENNIDEEDDDDDDFVGGGAAGDS